MTEAAPANRLLRKLSNAKGSSATTLRKCCDKGCCASLRSATTLVLKGESLVPKGEKAVDCIIFLLHAEELVLVLAELKSSGYSPRELRQKFDATEVAAKALAAKADVEIRSTLRAVFARRHPKVGTSQYVVIAKVAGARMRRCGEPITSLL